MQQLTLVPEGGLCNRIYAVTSAIALAKKYNLRLKVYWFKDWGMGAGFHDLFTLSAEVRNVEVKDAKLVDFFKYAKPIKRNLFLPKLYQKIKFGSTYFWYRDRGQQSVEEWLLSHKSAAQLYLFHSYRFYGNNECLSSLTPKSEVSQRIKNEINIWCGVEKNNARVIGVHIRRTDFKESIARSTTATFIEKMQQELVQNPSTKFYVASDSLEEKENMAHIFGNKIITTRSTLKRSTKAGIADALVELHLLASTAKILGSIKSSYSMLAAELNGIPLEIVTQQNAF